MKKRLLALAAAAVLVGASAHALTLRTLTGIVIKPDGTAIAAGSVVVTPTGRTPSSVPGGVVVPTTATYPVSAGAFTCGGACTIASPGNYRWQVYEVTGGQSVLRWTFNAPVAEASGSISFQEIYSATGSVIVGPSYLLAGSDAAQLGSDAALAGKVLAADGSGGAAWITSPAGVTDHALLSNLAYATSGHTGFVATTDARLTDARTPLAHAHVEGDVTGLVADLALKAPLASPTFTGTVTAPTFAGNASTATTAGDLTGTHADPAWLTVLSGSKLTGTVVATNGVVTTGTYPDPAWLTSLAGAKVTGNIAGNAGTVTNGVYTTGTYANPSWITSYAGSKITGDIPGNAANVTTTVAVANGGTGSGTAGGARTNLAVPPLTRAFTAGVGLTGGGDLSTDRTFDLAATAVGPGAYGGGAGSALVPSFTVDQQGRLTVAAAHTLAAADIGAATATALGVHAALSTGAHGVGANYIARTTRGDQWPSWADLVGVPGSFTPSAHVHSAADVTSGLLANTRGGTGLDTSGPTTGLAKVASGTWGVSTLLDADVNASAAIAWSKLSKSGSSLADLATRSATDLTSGTLAVAQGGTGLATLTAGYIPFGAGASALGSDAGLFWDNANKRLGIGTPSPSEKLHVTGNLLVVAAQATVKLDDLDAWGAPSGIQWQHTGSPTWTLGPVGDSTNNFHLSEGGTTPRLSVLTGGNVGIGTTAPGTTLHVLGSNTGGTRSGNSTYYGGGKQHLYTIYGDQYGNGSGYSYGTPNWPASIAGGSGGGYFHGGNGDDYSGGGAGILAIGGNAGIGTAEGGAGIFAQGGLNSDGVTKTFAGYFNGGNVSIMNGNVGIGTTGPNYLLDVNGTANATNYRAGGVAGMTTVVTVRNSGGAGDCTMTFSGGILTATTCSHT